MMRDACVVERADGFDVLPDLSRVQRWAPVYAGKCRVQRPGTSTAPQSMAGDYEFGVSTVLAQLPLAAMGIKRDHRFRVTEVGLGGDPDLLGLVATVRAVPTKTHATKRTLICEEVT